MRNNWQLFWGQGQFLTPQHFQQQDLFNEWQHQFYWRLGNPLGWGVFSLAIREDGLIANIFEISRCEIITRDGLILQGGSNFNHPNARIVPRKFDGLLDPSSGPLSVYLGLPRYQSGQRNLATDETIQPKGSLPTRYRLATHKRTDLFEAESEPADINVVEYNLPIFFENEEGFQKAEQAVDLVKIAELVPASVGQGTRLSTTYIPPCLNIESSSILASELSGVRDLLSSKGQEFEGLKRQRQDPIRLQMMQTLNRYIPLLHHMLEVGRMHPEPMYALLRQMVGELSVFSTQVSALGRISVASDEDTTDLPAYDHERLAVCFKLAVSRIRELVHSLDVGTDAGITLVRDAGYYKASLPPSVFEGERNRYYLMVDSPIRGESLWQRLRSIGKVSPIQDMPRLRQSAVFGLKIEFVPIPPEDLPQRGGNKTFFQIDTKDQVWARIKEQQNIALYCDLDSNETTVKLFVARDD